MTMAAVVAVLFLHFAFANGDIDTFALSTAQNFNGSGLIDYFSVEQHEELIVIFDGLFVEAHDDIANHEVRGLCRAIGFDAR